MKKFFSILLAASVLAAPVAFSSQASAAPLTHDEHRVVVKKGSWVRGHRMSPAERRRSAAVRDYRRYHLSAPPRGYQWVRIDNNYLLVGIVSGLISNVIVAR